MTARSIPAMALASAEEYAGDLAVLDGDVALSFVDVAREMRRLSGALITRGVQPGDRVALWAPNSAAWVVAALAVQAAGAWLVPLNTRFKPAEAAYVLDRTDARLLLVTDGFLGIDLAGVAAELPGHRSVRGAVHVPGPGAWDDTWEALLAEGDEVPEGVVRERLEAVGPDDVSDIIFTSGTTGSPKGVMLRHGTSLRAYASLNEGFGLRRGDRQLVVAPFFHCFGYKAGWMLSLMTGAACLPMAVFDAGAAVHALEALGVTHVPGAPTVFTALLDHPSRTPASSASLRVALVSAAAFSSELVRRMREELGLETVMTGYGLTENHALGSFTRPQDPQDLVYASAGRIAPDVEARIVLDGVDQPPGSPGELLLRGYTLMTGYYDDPDATAAAITEDGWLRTGDVAVLDAQGFLSITDRLKDIYVMGGFNVAPAEVEKVLSQHEAVAQVAVIGVPDPHFGEVGAAYAVLHPGAALTGEQLVAFARERMANYKVPRHVEVVEVLPTNASGKVLKGQLRHQVAT